MCKRYRKEREREFDCLHSETVACLIYFSLIPGRDYQHTGIPAIEAPATLQQPIFRAFPSKIHSSLELDRIFLIIFQ